MHFHIKLTAVVNIICCTECICTLQLYCPYFDGTLLALIKMSSNLKQVKQDYCLTIALKLVIDRLTVFSKYRCIKFISFVGYLIPGNMVCVIDACIKSELMGS